MRKSLINVCRTRKKMRHRIGENATSHSWKYDIFQWPRV